MTRHRVAQSFAGLGKSSEAKRVAEEACFAVSPKNSLRPDSWEASFFEWRGEMDRFTNKLARTEAARALAKEGEENGGCTESRRGGACSALRGGACSAQVPTAEERQLVTLRELFSAAELTDSCLATQN